MVKTADRKQEHSTRHADNSGSDAAVRSSAPQGELLDLAAALIDGKRLRAVSGAAARSGVRAGMTVNEARALCAGLEILPWDAAIIEAAITRTTAAFLAASPQVTPVRGTPGSWWIGAGGMGALGGEKALVESLYRIASGWHPGVRIGIASSCVAARAATWLRRAAQSRVVSNSAHAGSGSNGVRRSRGDASWIVPPGGCAAYLASVPLTLIPMEAELRDTLLALGIRTAGGFAVLAAEDVERRWGAEGLLAWQLSRGTDQRRPVLARAEVDRSVSAELAASTDNTEPLLFLVSAALDRLVTGLKSDARAAAAVAITLTLDDGRGALPAGGRAHTITREVRPARPLARVAPLLELCRTLLEGWQLPAPVCAVAVSITATAPATAEQGNLLAREWKDPAAAEAALDRLRAELGTNSVVFPVARDTHRPERAGEWVPLLQAVNGKTAATESAAQPPLALPLAPAQRENNAVDLASFRLLTPAEPVSVACVNGKPREVRWRSRVIRVAYARGPERLSGDWWSDGYTRDYWRCGENHQRGELMIYREAAGGWFMQGWWD